MADILCAECGFRSFPGLQDREHRIFHDEHFSGVRLRHLDRFEAIGNVGPHQVLLIRPESDLFARRRAERVSRRSIQEDLGEGGYDKPTFYAEDVYQIVPEMQSHALIATNLTRGIGLVVIERRERAAWFEWSEDERAYMRASDEHGGTSWAIVHAWVLSEFRGQGLAKSILNIALEGFGIEAKAAGWLTPFTSAGFGLVRHFTPSGFWAAGYKPPAGDSFLRPFVQHSQAAG